jgi:hypothetical protein
MTIPDNFDSWEHFQSTWKSSHNRKVREYFSDAGDDLSTPRSSAKLACIIEDNDTAFQAMARWLYFHGEVRKWEDLQTPIYGIPIGTYHETRKFKPQVRLYFREDLNDVDEGYRPLTGEITFRLMDETTETLTKNELTTLATKIKTNFVLSNNSGYRWHKGKTLLSYNDPEKGYKLQLFCFSKSDGKELIETVLDCQNHTPDWSKLTVNENESPASAYPTIPANQSILGKSVKQPRKRPSGYVRFQYATCAVWGLTKPVCLVDRIYRFLDPLVRA